MTTQTLPRKRAASPASFENSESPAKQQKKSEKENYIKQLRNYKDSQRQSVVEKHYTMMRKNQTLEFVKRMYKEHHSMNHRKMTLKEAFTALESFVDASDPDVDTPNYSHAFQAAEGARKAGCPDWMQLVALIHDLGKLVYLWGKPENGQAGGATSPQWAIGGDTWVVGCKIPDCVVFPEFNKLNPDATNPEYNTDLGIYEKGCGLNNLMLAYGHDEYLYRVLVHNKTKIPDEGLYMIRFHSCYPWHTGGAYSQFENDTDRRMKARVVAFNKFDLYTKVEKHPDPEKLWPYYEKLVDKYCPGVLEW